MKRNLIWAAFCAAMLAFVGCDNNGVDVDENKTPEAIKQEITSMSADDIKATVENYKQEIEEKTAEFKVEAEKLSKIPLLEQLGDEAKDIKEEMAEITESLKKLQDNMEAYLSGLQDK
ncbi:MAG: hypothetical protein RR060_04665 [Victivallaceae bacterium]